jgi:DNA-binding transcriptional LysR family regulator
MDEAEAEVTEAGASPRGLLRLHCGSTFGMHQLAPAIPRFQARHPAVASTSPSAMSRWDMMQEGVDLAIRIGPLDESSLVARRICNLERVICACARLPGTPRHAAHAGRPAAAQLPVDHQPAGPAPLALRHRRRHPRGPCRRQRGTNNAETVLQLAVAGVGVTRLSDVVVADAIRRGELVPILADWHHVEPVPLFATYPSGRNLSPKVRAMVDFLVEEFGGAPWRRQR